MKLTDTIKRSGRSLRQAKIRTFLTAAALAVGGFTLTATLAAANGARAYTNKLVSTNFDPSSLVVAKDKSLFGSNGVNSKPQEYDASQTTIGGDRRGGGMTVKELTQSDVNKIAALPGIQNVLVDYQVNVQYITRPNQKKYTGTVEVYNPAQKPTSAAGTVPNVLPAGALLLPDDYITLLGFNSNRDAIGKMITIQVQQLTGQTKQEQFSVAAVTTKPATSINFSASNVLLSTSDAKALYEFVNARTINVDKFLTVTAHVQDGTNKAKLDAAQSEIKKAGYAAESVQDTQQFLNQIITILQTIILVFGFITLIASFFGVVNTQYISVLERTREIGLMKALGMSRGTVSQLFIIEATWIGFIGALAGSFLSVAAGILINPWISHKLNFGSERLLIFRPLQIVLLIVFLMLVTTLAGLLPARKAAKLDPIEALRAE